MNWREWLHWLSLNVRAKHTEARLYALEHNEEGKE